MAITIVQQPPVITPVYNEQVFLFSSTNVSETGFQYIVDFYDNSTDLLITRHKIAPRPSNNYGLFNACGVAKTFVTHDISSATGFLACDNSTYDYYLKIGEEYEVTGTLTEFVDLTTSNVITTWNGCFDYYDFAAYNYATWTILNSSSKFLTSATSISVFPTQPSWLYFLHNTHTNVAEKLEIKTYDSSGTLVGTYVTTNALTGLKPMRIGVGPAQLNSLTLSSGSQPITTSSIYSYKIRFKNNSDTSTSETKTFYINYECSKYEQTTLIWLNKLGGFDSLVFDKVKRKNTDVTRKQYERIGGAISGSSYGYDVTKHLTQTYDVQQKERVTLNSDWITDEQAIQYEELISSPLVYIYESDTFHPVNIIDSTYPTKKRIVDKLFNLQVTIELGNKKLRQSY